MVDNPHLNKNILMAQSQLKQDIEDFKSMIRVVQSECEHLRVAHSEGRSSAWVGRLSAVRVCLHCGLEEQSDWGSYDHWATGNHTQFNATGDLQRVEKPTLDVDKLNVVKVSDATHYRIRRGIF